MNDPLEVCIKLKEWSWKTDPNTIPIELRAIINEACDAIIGCCKVKTVARTLEEAIKQHGR